MDAESIEELLEKKMLLRILKEALESLLPDERELAEKVIGERMPLITGSRRIYLISFKAATWHLYGAGIAPVPR